MNLVLCRYLSFFIVLQTLIASAAGATIEDSQNGGVDPIILQAVEMAYAEADSTQGESIERAPTAVLNDSVGMEEKANNLPSENKISQQSEAPVVNKKKDLTFRLQTFSIATKKDLSEKGGSSIVTEHQHALIFHPSEAVNVKIAPYVKHDPNSVRVWELNHLFFEIEKNYGQVAKQLNLKAHTRLFYPFNYEDRQIGKIQWQVRGEFNYEVNDWLNVGYALNPRFFFYTQDESGQVGTNLQNEFFIERPGWSFVTPKFSLGLVNKFRHTGTKFDPKDPDQLNWEDPIDLDRSVFAELELFFPVMNRFNLIFLINQERNIGPGAPKQEFSFLDDDETVFMFILNVPL